MEVIYRKLDELVKLENNPRKISQEQLDKLKESIERNPDYFEARPIILSDRTGELVIIAGNQRYEACRQLGVSEVPTVLMKGLTEEREREIVIRDNVSNGEWDMDALADWNVSELSVWGVETVSFEEEGREEETDEESKYTKKIEAPVYEPKEEYPPLIGELYNDEKYSLLKGRIDASDIPDDVKEFLYTAACRHIVFDYGKIAEYYSHAPKEVQELMEDSVLVIIDFDKAIENGYATLKKELFAHMIEDTYEEDEYEG